MMGLALMGGGVWKLRDAAGFSCYAGEDGLL
jgi:hypothetical protein